MVRDGRLELPTSCSQSKRATNCANPGFLVIEFCSRCGQTCGQAVFLTTSTCGGSACIAGVSRDCGHGIFRLEGGATRSQTRRDTNFAIPGYSISAIISRRGRKSKIFLSVVIYVVKPTFVPLSAIVENPANAGVKRLCGVSPCPVPDTATALPKQARYQLRYTRLLKLNYPAGRILPNQARYQLRYTRIFNLSHYITAVEKIKELFCPWSLCDQTRSRAAFGNRSRSHKTRSSQGTAQIGQGFCHEALLLYRLPSADASIICDGKTVFLRLRGGHPSWPRAPGGSHREAFWRSTMRFPLLRPP